MADRTRWRRELYTRMCKELEFWKDRKIVLPPVLRMSIGAKGNMFEMGGQNHSSGLAILVASPSGLPSHSRVLRRRYPCELHAAVTIWPGCIVAIGHHSMGKETMALYTVQSVNRVDTQSFGTVDLRRIAYKSEFDTNKYWYETDQVIPGVEGLVATLKDKLYEYNCTEPRYIEPFHDMKLVERYALLDRLQARQTKEKVKVDAQGIGDSLVESEAVCDTYENFMESIRRTADDLHENFDYKFVWVLYGYYLKGKTLVCQARHVMNSEGPYHPQDLHHVMHVVKVKDVEEIREYLKKFNPEFHRVLFGTAAFDVLWKGICTNPKETLVNFTKYAKCTDRILPDPGTAFDNNSNVNPVIEPEMTEDELNLEADAEVAEVADEGAVCETFGICPDVTIPEEYDTLSKLNVLPNGVSLRTYYNEYWPSASSGDVGTIKSVYMRRTDPSGEDDPSLVEIECDFLVRTPCSEPVQSKVSSELEDGVICAFDFLWVADKHTDDTDVITIRGEAVIDSADKAKYNYEYIGFSFNRSVL